MSNQQLYSLIFVGVNGKTLCEEISVNVRRVTGAQLIKTVAKGFAGLSPGAIYAEVDVENAIPSADFELDPGPFMEALANLDLTLALAGKIGRTKGFIIEDTFKHGVDSPSGMGFKFIGSFPRFQ